MHEKENEKDGTVGALNAINPASGHASSS